MHRAWWIAHSGFCFLAIATPSLAAAPVDLVETCIHTVSRMDTLCTYTIEYNSRETLEVCLICIRAFRIRAGCMDAACLPHLAAKGFAGQMLVLVAVLHSVWTVAVLD
jgi:hypothetical protein